METLNFLKSEVAQLKVRLAEAEETLNAIRSGEVDALVVAGADGDQVFTLKGAEMPYRILVEEMNQGALMLIPDGTILYANTRFSVLSKTPLEQIIGSSWQNFFPRDKYPQLEAHLKTGELITPPEELSLQAADGSFCPVQLSLRSMNTSGMDGFSVIVTDLTERKQSDHELRKISEELLEKNGQLESFSYNISHDIRAPLRHMRSYANILLEDCGDTLQPESKSYLKRIVLSSERLERLITDVLIYSRLSGAENKVTTLDLLKIVREIVDTFPNLRDADIELIDSFEKIRGHEVGLGQCISNLLCNALKFVPAGRVPHVKVWIEPANGRMRLWVQDNGIGISLKDQKNIFRDFTRLHSNDLYEGTGLGLSMVKKAVEKMGGNVGVESELGEGSRFWIELDRA